MSEVPTASQTVGPFFSIGLAGMCRTELQAHASAGENISVRGRVLDGDGRPVPDAMLEIWHADAGGKYDSQVAAERLAGADVPAGFGRIATNDQGEFRFTTGKPGAVHQPDGTVQAPHLAVVIFMRGLQRHLLTRMYFSSDGANVRDPVLELVPAERRATLLAAPSELPGEFLWDIRLQGERETVFFET